MEALGYKFHRSHLAGEHQKICLNKAPRYCKQKYAAHREAAGEGGVGCSSLGKRQGSDGTVFSQGPGCAWRVMRTGNTICGVRCMLQEVTQQRLPEPIKSKLHKELGKCSDDPNQASVAPRRQTCCFSCPERPPRQMGPQSLPVLTDVQEWWKAMEWENNIYPSMNRQ